MSEAATEKKKTRTADLNEIRADLKAGLLYSDSVGETPYTVGVFERVKRDKTQIWARYEDEEGNRREKLLEVRTIRDAQGRPVNKLRDRAKAEATVIYERLAGLAEPAAKEEKPTRLTLQQGLAAAFGTNGMWKLPKDDEDGKRRRGGRTKREQWGIDVHRYLSDLIALFHQHNGRDPEAKPIHFDEVTPGWIRSIIDALAEESAAHRKGKGDDRATKMLRNLSTLCDWLSREHPDLRFPALPKKWRKDLDAAWKEHTGRDLERERAKPKPRHTLEELGRMLANLDDPRVDRRLALVLRIGGGAQRIGQVRETMRSRYDDAPGAGIGHGALLPPSAGNKGTVPIFLTSEERAWLDLEMCDGYLRELEKAYQAGMLEDYPLFAAGKMRHPAVWDPENKTMRRNLRVPGYISLETLSGRPVDKKTLNEAFHLLEKISDVPHVENRAWYGIKRLVSDVYEQLAREGVVQGADRKALNVAQGWDPNSTVRDDVYQDNTRGELHALSTELRRHAIKRSMEGVAAQQEEEQESRKAG